MDAFEDDAPWLPLSAADDDVFAVVERIVLALNALDKAHGRIETGEREELCEYIDGALGEAGVDVRALTDRRGIGRHELTDSWRDW